MIGTGPRTGKKFKNELNLDEFPGAQQTKNFYFEWLWMCWTVKK